MGNWIGVAKQDKLEDPGGNICTSVDFQTRTKNRRRPTYQEQKNKWKTF